LVSTNDQPPFIGPGLPFYPQISQVVRIGSDAPLGSNVYPGFIQQWTPNLTLRDREACYLWEPNGIKLNPGYYDGRLVTNYQGLPLLVTWCCPSASSSLSLTSSAAPSGLRFIQTIPRDYGSGTSAATGFAPSAPIVGNKLVALTWGKQGATPPTGVSFSDSTGAGQNPWTVPTGWFQRFSLGGVIYFAAVGFTQIVHTQAGMYVVANLKSGNSDILGVVAVEFGGVQISTPQDGTVAGGPSSGSTFTLGNLSLSASDLVLAVAVNDDTANPSPLTPPAGWQVIVNETDGLSFVTASVLFKIAPASPTAPSWADSNAPNWGGLQAALLPS